VYQPIAIPNLIAATTPIRKDHAGPDDSSGGVSRIHIFSAGEAPVSIEQLAPVDRHA
jgi:hypothetical protein